MGLSGETGATGPTGPTGPAASVASELWAETIKLGSVNTRIAYNQGGGNNQAVGAIVYSGSPDITVSEMSAYIVQTGGVTGDFQMAILAPVSDSNAVVIALTHLVSSISAGLITLPLIQPITLINTLVYYFAIYDQVNASYYAGSISGLGTTQNAPPINFRAQNLTGFTLGQNVNISDVSLSVSPWIAAHP